MEHHPFWHVGTPDMDNRSVHAHEAAHGWYGNGVRIECWEDFVLSEGVATYLEVRAIEAADGETVAMERWLLIEEALSDWITDYDTIALPDETCNEIDIAEHPLWSAIPYLKGALFLRAVEGEVGRAELDAALRGFYEANVGQAARMQELLDHIEAETGFDVDPLAETWLRSLAS